MVVRLKDLEDEQPKKTGIVRLKDIESGSNTQKSGVVRLSDLKTSKPMNPKLRNFLSSTVAQDSSNMMSNAIERIKQESPRQGATQSEARLGSPMADKLNREEIPAYSLPVIGPILTKIDQFANLGRPASKVGAQLYTPGAGLSNTASFMGATGSAISRVAPGLGTTTSGRIAQEAIKEGVTGVPLAAGQALATGQDMDEVAKQAVLGGVIGGAGGAAFSAASDAVRAGVQAYRNRPQQQLNTTINDFIRRTEQPTASTEVIDQAVRRESPSVIASQAVETQPRDRGFNRTLRESGQLTDEVQQGMNQSPNRTYEPITNRDTVARANQRITQSMDDAESYVMGGRGQADAEQIATGMRLIQELQSRGQTARAVTVAENLADKLTRAGQTVQAASIWNRLTPEGALLSAQRKVAEINRTSSKLSSPVKITDQDATKIQTAAQAIQRSGASQERAAQVMDITEKMRAGQSISDDERNIVSEFVKDLRQFVRPNTTIRPPRPPKELSDKRVRDRVVSFFDEQEQAARARLNARRNTLSSTPLDQYADYGVILASKIAKGTVKTTDLVEDMVREFGEQIRPHMGVIMDKAQDILNQNTGRISQQAYSRAERLADSYLKRNEKNLNSADIEFVRGLSRQVSELSGDARRTANMDLQAVLNSFEKAGIGKKLSSAQYMSMLLNPVTQVRNIVGNEILYRMERINRLIATPMDIVSSTVSGKPREITFRSGPVSWQNFFAPTKDYWKGLAIGSKAGWRGVNPDGLTTAYDISGQAFKSKLNPLTYFEKTLGAVMKGFDYAAYNRAVNQRLREMALLNARNQGIRGRENIQQHIDRYLTNLDENIADIAKEYGKYVTFQDNTLLSRSAVKGRNLLNFNNSFGVGSIVLPFAKTPANLLTRAIEYSPLGFGRAIMQTGDILLKRNTDLTRADVIQSVTRALLGTGLGGAGVWLADKGVLKGDTSSDRDVRQLERQAGISQYQLNSSALQRMISAMVTGNANNINQAAELRPGDVLWQYEWAQPTSIPIAIGANIAQERQEEEPSSRLKQTADVVSGGLNTLMNTSFLQGLQESFDFQPGEENKVGAFFENLAKQVPSMFTPSMINRINMYMDDAQRDTYSTDFEEYMLNQVRGRVPGISEDLPQRISTLGQQMTRSNSFFDVFINPANRSKFKPSEEAIFVMDLLSETGEERIAPRAVPRYITGTDRATKESKRIDLTGEQYARYQQIVGEEVVKGIQRIRPNWSTERKVERMIKVLNDAGSEGRKQMRRELGLR